MPLHRGTNNPCSAIPPIPDHPQLSFGSHVSKCLKTYGVADLEIIVLVCGALQPIEMDHENDVQ